MCTSCILAVGGFLGAVALMKAGGLGGAKAAVVAFAAGVILRRGR
jgi:hypothetical protein